MTESGKAERAGFLVRQYPNHIRSALSLILWFIFQSVGLSLGHRNISVIFSWHRDKGGGAKREKSWWLENKAIGSPLLVYGAMWFSVSQKLLTSVTEQMLVSQIALCLVKEKLDESPCRGWCSVVYSGFSVAENSAFHFGTEHLYGWAKSVDILWWEEQWWLG